MNCESAIAWLKFVGTRARARTCGGTRTNAGKESPYPSLRSQVIGHRSYVKIEFNSFLMFNGREQGWYVHLQPLSSSLIYIHFRFGFLVTTQYTKRHHILQGFRNQVILESNSWKTILSSSSSEVSFLNMVHLSNYHQFCCWDAYLTLWTSVL